MLPRPLVAALFARLVPAAPDPVGLARALESVGLDHVCLLHAAEAPSFGPRFSYVAACPDRESTAFDPLLDDEPLAEGTLATVPRWIGVLPYEAFRHLERPEYRAAESRSAPLLDAPKWLRFPAVLRVDASTGEVLAVGESSRAVARLIGAVRHAAPSFEPPRLVVADADPPERHLARVARARELILAGDLYQVNLARRLDVRVEGEWLAAYAALARRAPPAYGAALNLGACRVLCTSPELALHGPVRVGSGQASWLYTEPIKGTRPRGRDAPSDEEESVELDACPKERAELAMIVDVERNDLGRVAQLGTVRLARPPAVVTHRTVHHRKALLAAELRDGVSRRELLEAMLPSGSVTGAPKIRAMEVIAELEAHRRGLYTGALGFAAHDGSFTLAMAIRTLVMSGQGERWQGEYHTGGGIVADSNPERELVETRWKAAQLGANPR